MRQWDDAMEQMKRNDDAIQAATQLFADNKARLREMQVKLDISAKFLDDTLVNNKEREAQIDVLNRDIERVRGTYTLEQVRKQSLGASAVVCLRVLCCSCCSLTSSQNPWP